METKKSIFLPKEEKGVNLNTLDSFNRELFKQSVATEKSGNGSTKLSTTGNPFVDQFASIANYRNPRQLETVFTDCKTLWKVNPLMSLQIMCYIRLISRDAKLPDGTKIEDQVGQGLKSEFWSRLYWLGLFHPETFKANLDIFVTVGSWDDLFELLRLDVSLDHGYTKDGKVRKTLLDWKYIIRYITVGLGNEQVSELIKKYMPSWKAISECKTIRNQANNYIASRLAGFIFPDLLKAVNDSRLASDAVGPLESTAKKLQAEAAVGTAKANLQRAYRTLKSSGTAHTFQKLISQERYDEIDFKLVPGRVLKQWSTPQREIKFTTPEGKTITTKGDGLNFIQRHNLEDKFLPFVKNAQKIKYTGFVYELFAGLYEMPEPVIADTINKQFATLLEQGKNEQTKAMDALVVLDVSSSMDSAASGISVSCYEVGLSMALYFSELMSGRFHNKYWAFAYDCKELEFNGETPVEKFVNADRPMYGSTDVLKVAMKMVNLRKSGVEESEFPNTIICITDTDFDCYIPNKEQLETTYDQFRCLLSEGFSKEYCANMRIVLWNLSNYYYGTSRSASFEALADEKHCYMIGGLDPAAIKFLVSGGEEPPSTPEDIMKAALNQELLNRLEVKPDAIKTKAKSAKSTKFPKKTKNKR